MTLRYWGEECLLKLTMAMVVLLMVACSFTASAQDNYEIQVYGADTVAPKTVMLELHSNYTVNGFKSMPGSRYQAGGTFPNKPCRTRNHRDYRWSHEMV